MKKFIKNQGFTLIELMVVIAIIGVLSSVVLASLGSTKQKAKDSTVKQIVGQMRSILATQYAENPNSPSYFTAAAGWVIYNGGANPTNECATDFTAGFTAANAANLVTLCNQIATLTAGQPGNVFFLSSPDYTNTNAGGSGHLPPCDTFGQCYVILAKLPSNGTYYCASGKQGTPANSSTGDIGTFLTAGCWDNP